MKYITIKNKMSSKVLKQKLAAKRKANEKLVESFRRLLHDLRAHHSHKTRELKSSQNKLRRLQNELKECRGISASSTSIKSSQHEIKLLKSEIAIVEHQFETLTEQHDYHNEETDNLINALLELEEEELEYEE
jgi:hypothetical protein